MSGVVILTGIAVVITVGVTTSQLSTRTADPQAADPVGVTPLDTDESSAAPVATPELPPSRLPGGIPVDPALFLVTAMQDERFEFVSPSGNIMCGVATGLDWGAACWLAEHTWSYPPCASGLGEGWSCWPKTVLDADGFVSVIGFEPNEWEVDLATQYGQPVRTLQYGESISVGTVTCVSTADGMFCEDERTHHGFAVSRSTYEEY